MQTFTFQELTTRAQDAAIARYGEDQAITEEAAAIMDEDTTGQEYAGQLNERDIFTVLDWRFTEHGERIA